MTLIYQGRIVKSYVHVTVLYQLSYEDPYTGSRLWVFIAQLVEHCSTNTEATGLKPRKTFFWATLQLLKLQNFNCDGYVQYIHFTIFYGRYMKGVPFLSKMVNRRVRVWTLEPPSINHCCCCCQELTKVL